MGCLAIKYHYHQPQLLFVKGGLFEARKRANPYRFGFNGQEKDNEVSGEGNSMTAEYWQYDSRLGRRWNVDPIFKDWESPYACFANTPILFNDPFGLDGGPPGGAGTRKQKGKADYLARQKKEQGFEDVNVQWSDADNGWLVYWKAKDYKLDENDRESGILYERDVYKVGGWTLGGIQASLLNFGSNADESARNGKIKDIAVPIGQTITEYHPGVIAYNAGSKFGFWGDQGKNVWGDEQSTAGVILDITPFGKLSKIAKVAGIVNDGSKIVKKTSGWVKRAIFNSLDPSIQKKVTAAIEKGIVSPTGQQGIIKLTATEAAATGYQYKVKILGKGGDIRIYGNAMENGHILFDKIIKH